jgi:hypothetical protein
MWITDKITANACNIFWRNNWLESWSWDEYNEKKKVLWDSIVLVDMINHPLPDSVAISNELFDPSNKPEWTIFALYCHSGGSSWYIQSQLAPQLPMYTFVNISGGIMSYSN